MQIRHMAFAWAFASTLLAGCASKQVETIGPPTKEIVYAVTATKRLIQFNAGQPQKILSSKSLAGLAEDERIVGIDYRASRGQLYALGASGQLYRVNTALAQVSLVGSPAPLPRDGATEWGIEVDPAVDRIRLVNNVGLNLRLHPDTGAPIDGNAEQPGIQSDGRLAYDGKDKNSGRTPAIVALGIARNKSDDKHSTSYALDGKLGALVHLGSKEGASLIVSPNSGKLYTVGSLDIGSFEHASMDIAHASNTAYAAITQELRTRWYSIELATGRASLVGTIGGEELVISAAIEP